MRQGTMDRASKSCFTVAALAALSFVGIAHQANAQISRTLGPVNIYDQFEAGEIMAAKKAAHVPKPPVVPQTDGSWNVNNSTVWSLATSWLSGNIADGVGATGNFLFDITQTRTVTIDGAVASRTLGIMNIGDTNASNNYTIAASGGGTLTFDNGGSNAQLNNASTSGTNNTISAPVSLTSSLNVSNASANTLTIGGIVGGAGNLNHMSGVLALTAVNTYSGNTTITGGRVTVDGDATLGNGAGTLFLSGGTLSSTATRTVSTDPIANNIVVTADSAIATTSTAATVNLNLTGTLSGSAGTLTLRNDAASGTGVFEVRSSAGDFTMNRPIVLDNGAGTSSTRLSDFNTTGTTHTYNGVISGNGAYRRSATASGTGGLTVFTAANTYTGATSINDGTLQLGNGGATGSLSTSSVITFGASTGVFKINRNNAVVQGTDFSGAAITGPGSFVHGGTGTVTLNVANTYSGGTTVTGGVFAASGPHAPVGSIPELIATADGALGTGNVSLLTSGVRLTLQGGATNNYISDNRTLSIVTGAMANLNFTGAADTINALVLGGVMQAPGTHNATTDPLFFIGNGDLLVLIPEPSTWAMTLMGAGLLMSVQRFRRRKS